MTTTITTGAGTTEPCGTGTAGPLTVTISSRALRDLVRPVLPHAGTVRELPVLNTVHLYTRAGYLVAEATDRYTAALSRTPTTTRDGFDVVVPVEAVRRILGVFKPTRKIDPDLQLTTTVPPAHPTDGPHTLTVSGTGLVDVEGATLRFALELGGEFPRLHKLFPPILTTRRTGRTSNPGAPGAATSDRTIHGDRSGVLGTATGYTLGHPEPLPADVYNPVLLARFTAAQRRGEPMVCRRAGRFLAVTIGDHFLGAVMPVALDPGQPGQSGDLTGWATVLEHDPAKAAA